LACQHRWANPTPDWSLSRRRLGVGQLKVGTLVSLTKDPDDYPQYKGKLALIVEERNIDTFVVMVDGKLHPYFVHRCSMEVISESR
jgi:hypothetical protein